MKHTIYLGVGAMLGLLCSSLHGQVPQRMNYQGRVVVGGVNFNGTGQFKFAFVDSAGTTTYWSNDGTSIGGAQPTNAVSISVSNGLYSVQLGDTSLANMTKVPGTVFNNSKVLLRVWFNDGTHGSQLLSPDQRIASVGYAFLAAAVGDPSGVVVTGGGPAVTLETEINSLGNNQLAVDGDLGATNVNTANVTAGTSVNTGDLIVGNGPASNDVIYATGGGEFTGSVSVGKVFNTNFTSIYLGSDGNAQFSGNVQAQSFSQSSDRNAKEKFRPVNAREILSHLATLPVETWNFKQGDGVKHIGPMAQDFYDAFQVGPDDKHIATVDADGVAFAAIQGLNEIVKEQNEELAAKTKKIDALEKRLDAIEKTLKQNPSDKVK